MLTAYNQFLQNFIHVRDLGALHDTLIALGLPNDLSDLLRGQWVYAVSALDKLVHELVRIGMLQAFVGTRTATPSFSNFGITNNTLLNIRSGPIPPPEFWFEQEILTRHQTLAFQHPSKIADALSLIWQESHKWQKISTAMAMPQNVVKTTLTTIVTRRNQIVHEADIDPLTNARRTISRSDTTDAVDFIDSLGRAIFSSVV